MMPPTPYPDANAIIAVTLAALREELGPKLVGVAIFGSLVTGAYEPGISDIDLVAALTGDLDATEGAGLERMHSAIAAAHPEWAERIEVGYLSRATLAAFVPGLPMGRISPGEPFHLTDAGPDWRFNLAFLRERGVAVWGPEPRELVGEISAEEMRDGLRELMIQWRSWFGEAPHIDQLGYQGYIVLTMCRALHLARTGRAAGKLEAAAWTEREMPDLAPLIRDALLWRRRTALGEPLTGDPARTLPAVLALVGLVVAEVLMN